VTASKVTKTEDLEKPKASTSKAKKSGDGSASGTTKAGTAITGPADLIKRLSA